MIAIALLDHLQAVEVNGYQAEETCYQAVEENRSAMTRLQKIRRFFYKPVQKPEEVSRPRHVKNRVQKIRRGFYKIFRWHNFFSDKNNIEINYELIEKRMNIIKDDLMKAVYHPHKLQYYLNIFHYDIVSEVYVD